MTELLFIRHGATAGNLEKRYIGRTDEALSETGLEQVKQLADRNIHADKVIVSPMKRTVQTAEIVFPGKSRRVIADRREAEGGSGEGHKAGGMSDGFRLL